MARRGGVPVSAHDDAREAVAALARAVRRVHDAADAVGEAHDADLESELDALAWDAGEGRIGLIVLREDENYLSDKGFCAWLKGTEARFTGIQLLAGIASYGNTSPLAQRYQEALQAIDVGTRIWPGRNCYSFTELGVFQILVPMSRTDVTERFVQQTLGALLEYDQQKGADLVVTLDAILTYPNLREAADKLFIHYKTLLFRRKRIEELLKMSLDDADNRVSLSVALRMWRLSH